MALTDNERDFLRLLAEQMGMPVAQLRRRIVTGMIDDAMHVEPPALYESAAPCTGSSSDPNGLRLGADRPLDAVDREVITAALGATCFEDAVDELARSWVMGLMGDWEEESWTYAYERHMAEEEARENARLAALHEEELHLNRLRIEEARREMQRRRATGQTD